MDIIDKTAEMLEGSNNIVAFTGAGASTESNIPDFRSSGGVFDSIRKKYGRPPEVLLSYSFFISNPEVFYDYYKNSMIFLDAKPNNCHKVLAEWEKEGKLKAVVTQNIDGLHQAAGSKIVFELHGSISRNYCMKCGKRYSLEQLCEMEGTVPKCGMCGGIVRPDVVLYEEMLDHDVINGAVNAIRNADVMLVIGSSLVVYPAAGLLNYYNGNKLILINRDPTPYDSRANLVINRSAGEVLSEIYNKVG